MEGNIIKKSDYYYLKSIKGNNNTWFEIHKRGIFGLNSKFIDAHLDKQKAEEIFNKLEEDINERR